MRFCRFVFFLVFLGLLALPGRNVSAQSADEFTVIALPDTQHYSRIYPHILKAQTEWIVAQREDLNIQFVLGLGDIVDYGSNITQWQNADAGYDVLDTAGIPYALSMGNHDYDEAKPSLRTGTYYKTWFGPERYSQPHLAPSFRGGYPEGTTENFYSVFNVQGVDYLVLVMEFYPRDAALNWADSVLQAHQDKKVIVLTHSFVYSDDSRVAKCDANTAESFGVGDDNDGEEMWNKLVKLHPNIFLVLNGHIKEPGTGRLAELGVNGNLVNQVLSNYQHEAEGGGGYLRILRFKPSQNRIDVSTYSPYYDTYRTDAENQFTLEMHNTGTNATGSGQVVGRVRAHDCSKLADATVGYSGGSVQTDAQGLFTLPALPGTQAVSAEATGYNTGTADVSVNDGYDTAQDFFLGPAAGSGNGSCSTGTTNTAVVICSPKDGSTVSSPVRVQATASSPNGIARLELWVDRTKVTEVFSAQMDTQLSAADGKHRIVVVAVEPGGNNFKTTIHATVSSPSTNQPPVANLSVTPSSGTAPLTVLASTAESTDPDGTVASSIIDFGNGVTAPGPSASYTYQTAGTYTVTATVYDDKNASSTAAATVSVSSDSPVTRALTIQSPTEGSTVSSPVQVQATASSPHGIARLELWVDGAKVTEVFSSQMDTQFTAADGQHRIVVVAVERDGKYFNSVVNATVSSPSTNQPPVANLSVTPSSGTAPLTVLASTAESTDPDGTVASSIIDFGNGVTAPGPSASYTYQTAGTYTVTATVYDDKDASSSATATVNVSAATETARAVTIHSPAHGSTVTSPVRIWGTATSDTPVTLMQIYIEGKKVTEVAGSSIDTSLSLSRGKRRITVQARDSKGYYKETVNVTVQ